MELTSVDRSRPLWQKHLWAALAAALLLLQVRCRPERWSRSGADSRSWARILGLRCTIPWQLLRLHEAQSRKQPPSPHLHKISSVRGRRLKKHDKEDFDVFLREEQWRPGLKNHINLHSAQLQRTRKMKPSASLARDTTASCNCRLFHDNDVSVIGARK